MSARTLQNTRLHAHLARRIVPDRIFTRLSRETGLGGLNKTYEPLFSSRPLLRQVAVVDASHRVLRPLATTWRPRAGTASARCVRGEKSVPWYGLAGLDENAHVRRLTIVAKVGTLEQHLALTLPAQDQRMLLKTFVLGRGKRLRVFKVLGRVPKVCQKGWNLAAIFFDLALGVRTSH